MNSDIASIRALLASRQPKVGTTLFIAVDGRGGSGKSTLADLLAQQLDAGIIHTDDFASWENTFNWWPLIISKVFEPIMDGAAALSYERTKWWDNHYPVPASNEPVKAIMILEGVSALRDELRKYISIGIYVDTPRDVCFQRGLQRDVGNETGESKAKIQSLWQQWQRDEDAYFARVNPKDAADIVVDGTKRFEDQLAELATV